MRFSRAAKKLSPSLLPALAATLWAIACPGAQARELVDATSAKVRLADSPRRIVTLAPSLGELAAELDPAAPDRIVGVSDYTDYPPSLSRKESIGPYSRINLEKVVALRPDLVLATLDGNSREQVLHLRELGVPVVIVGGAGFKEVADSMRLVARAIGCPDEGERMVRRLEAGLAEIRARAAKRKGARPKVLLQVGDEPLVAVGRSTFLHEALGAIGAENAYGDSSKHYPTPAIEDALHRDPDAILVLALGKDIAPYERMAARWGRFASLKAVRARAVRVLQADALLRPTLRLLQGLAALEKAVYGAR